MIDIRDFRDKIRDMNLLCAEISFTDGNVWFYFPVDDVTADYTKTVHFGPTKRGHIDFIKACKTFGSYDETLDSCMTSWMTGANVKSIHVYEGNVFIKPNIDETKQKGLGVL